MRPRTSRSIHRLLALVIVCSSFAAVIGFTFAVADAVKVLGSRIEVDGKPVIVAREITKGNAKLELRDANGRPLWAGGPH
jgi:hypothetical protein